VKGGFGESEGRERRGAGDKGHRREGAGRRRRGGQPGRGTASSPAPGGPSPSPGSLEPLPGGQGGQPAFAQTVPPAPSAGNRRDGDSAAGEEEGWAPGGPHRVVTGG